MRGPALALSLAVALVPAPAAAASYVLTTNLSGLNEIPAITSPGSGTATATLDDVANTLLIQSTFAGLFATTVTGAPSGTVAAHIHCCRPLGVNSPVATALPAFEGFPLGVTSGTYSRSFDLGLSSFYNPSFVTARGGVTNARNAFVAGLLSGQTYFNIHTNRFPGGEIRGQFPAVPEPASWAMMILGFGLAGVALRGRRRRGLRV